MTRSKLFVVMAAGLSAAACSSTVETTRVATPTATVYTTGSEQACASYGFRAGTDSYNRCVVRESEARARGRVPATYTMASLTADSQAACASYGLVPGTMSFDSCVGREIDARRYRDQAAVVTTYPAGYPAPGQVVYTTPPGSTVVYTPAPVTYVPAAPPPPPTGVQAFRDEFGFRYDGQGNRIDARGNIISPQSTRP